MTKTIASRELIIALRRKRGEQNLNSKELAAETGISSRTLREFLNSEGDRPTRPSTLAKLNRWLYERV